MKGGGKRCSKDKIIGGRFGKGVFRFVDFCMCIWVRICGMRVLLVLIGYCLKVNMESC